MGVTAKVALSDCIAHMLYTGGNDDINAAWQGIWYGGGPLAFYGGHNREGLVTAQGLYDGHGAGKNAGSTGTYRIYIIFGTQDRSVNYPPYGCLPEGAGLFGGYPTGIGGIRAVFHTDGESLMEGLRAGDYPIQPAQPEPEGREPWPIRS